MSGPLGFLTTCPKCGRELTPFVGDGQSAPWLCVACCRGFWCAELSAAARARFRPVHGDFGHAPIPGLLPEWKAGIARKHSIPDVMRALPGVAGRLDAFLAMRHPAAPIGATS